MAYEINININTVDGEIQENNGISKNTTNGNKPTELDKARKQLKGFVSAQTIEPFIQGVKTQIAQNIQVVTGNTELQQRVNFGMEAIQYGVHTYKNAQAGALIATGLGLSGGVGALIGVGLTAANTAIQIGFNQHQINLEKRMENYQLQQLKDRQGIAYNRSRS